MHASIVLVSIVAVLSSTAKAGNFYTSATNKIYYVESAYNYNWFESHIECHNKNMTLFTIENEDSFYDLYNVLISGKFSRKPPHLWVGAVGSQRKFTWILNGKPVIWKHGSFDNARNSENCLQLYENTKDLNDVNCVNKMGFVCEENRYQIQCDQTKMAQKNVVLNIHQHRN
ncbi:E-selectin-like [Calliphora vicina]|uniref:E-selectin-like n=1 Tax=Calliphora vicina TaxID=7373 RepID=UPI00325B7A01